MKTKLWFTPVLFVWAGATVGMAHAEERYYVTVFAAQGEPNLPRWAHTFAAFVKASKQGKPAEERKIDIHTISWLPKTMSIEPLRLSPQAGHNFDMLATLKWAQSNNLKVTAWGPYPVKKELHDLALKQVEALNRGKLGYIALDRRLRGNGATNCIHAVSDLDSKQASLDTGPAFGEAASRLVVRHLSRHFEKTDEDTSWLRDRLDLKKYEARALDNDK